jgi:hypothetical protein
MEVTAMHLLSFLLVSLGIFALLHFAWIPSVERGVRIDRSMATISRTALLSLLGLLRGVFLIISLTSAAIMLILLLLQATGGSTVSEVSGGINTIQMWRKVLLGFGSTWGMLVTILLILALAIYARRSGRLRMEKAFQKVFDREIERLKQELEAGSLEELPPSNQMMAIQSQMADLLTMYEKIKGTDASNPEIAVYRQKLDQASYLLEQQYLALDFQRRIDMRLNQDEALLPEPRVIWEKIQTFFISRGLLASLSRGTRVIFLVSLLLLVPSITSIYSVKSATVLDSKLVQLNDLRVELSKAEWEKEKDGLGQPSKELTEEDKQTLRQVARLFEETSSSIYQIRPNISMYMMRSTLSREAILTQAAKRSVAAWEQLSSGSKVASLTELERQIVYIPEQALKTRDPITSAGRHLYNELEDIARRVPSFTENLKSGLRSFQKPARVYDISFALINNLVGNVGGSASDELGSLLKGMQFKESYKTIGWVNEAQSRSFLTSLVNGKGLENAIGGVAADVQRTFIGPFELAEYQSVMRTVSDRLPVKDISNKLADYPPGVEAVVEKHVDVSKAIAKVNEIKAHPLSSRGFANADNFADCLAKFSDWFPGQLGADSHTERSKLLASWEAGNNGPVSSPPSRPPTGPNPGGGASIPNVPISRPNFVRARSFAGLRGFSRVGGVLIGRPPEVTDRKADFVDFRWEIKGQEVRMILIKSDGQELRSRLYRLNLAYHALNYAADGRPLAVTMAKAEPMLGEYKIFLHPTLIDTPLGHRIIELDRFEETFENTNAHLYRAWAEANSRVKAHEALYHFAWANRLLILLPELPNFSEKSQYMNALNTIVNNTELKTIAEKAFEEPESLSNPEQSPITVKKEFFDETLVQAIISKAKKGMTPGQFGDAIKALAKVEVADKKDDEEDFNKLARRWMSLPPKFEFWSGVREQEYQLDPASFIVAEGTEIPMPFEFMRQIAFTSEPAFLNSENAESYTDSQPWEFPLLKNLIQDTVLNSVLKEPKSRTILADASEFAMLQRLFRLIFTGQFGEDFPVEKLVAFGEAIKDGAPKSITRTLRWNANPSLYSALLTNNIAEEERHYIEAIWDLRKALGVDTDSEQVLKEREAPLSSLYQ